MEAPAWGVRNFTSNNCRRGACTGDVGQVHGADQALVPHPGRIRPAGAIVTGSGPEITRGYNLIISGAKHDFYNQFFALISNFLSGGPYLSGNDSFIKSSSIIDENLNLNSHGSSEQKFFSFFPIFYINFRFSIFSLFFIILTQWSLVLTCPTDRASKNASD